MKDHFDALREKAGALVIKLRLERIGIIMNHKKIRRLMRKYTATIRRANPYLKMAKAIYESTRHALIC
ncbi:hypothetical protein [Brevibacillus panacihumi]|uniref:hypothetical protein n=1 Tax=Brevibacillus panacihumi TaxID=497735 RepID=UPI001181F7B4|nr:hypothetical protein [Brevibacillus panacihumi]